MTNEADFFLREAIQLAREGMTSGQGGPFGSVIVRDGVIVGPMHQLLRDEANTVFDEWIAMEKRMSY